MTYKQLVSRVYYRKISTKSQWLTRIKYISHTFGDWLRWLLISANCSSICRSAKKLLIKVGLTCEALLQITSWWGSSHSPWTSRLKRAQFHDSVKSEAPLHKQISSFCFTTSADTLLTKVVQIAHLIINMWRSTL